LHALGLQNKVAETGSVDTSVVALLDFLAFVVLGVEVGVLVFVVVDEFIFDSFGGCR